MKISLHPEVAAALDRAGVRIRAFRQISRMQVLDGNRVAYRIDLDSGRTIKARRVQSERIARQIFNIRRELPYAFAPAFYCYGAVLIEDWINGEDLDNEYLTDELLHCAATLLAYLHTMPDVAGHPVQEVRSTALWRVKTLEDLKEILAFGGINAKEELLLSQALERFDPEFAMFGLVHTDFCGENMLVDRDGLLRVIDNEHFGVDALGYDLARTWYRWWLPVHAWERFRSAYIAQVPFADSLKAFNFWSIVAVVRSTVLRLRKDRTRLHVPLERLRQMAVNLVRQQTPLW
jgi:thiamine kinase-like enzyme